MLPCLIKKTVKYSAQALEPSSWDWNLNSATYRLWMGAHCLHCLSLRFPTVKWDDCHKLTTIVLRVRNSDTHQSRGGAAGTQEGWVHGRFRCYILQTETKCLRDSMWSSENERAPTPGPLHRAGRTCWRPPPNGRGHLALRCGVEK